MGRQSGLQHARRRALTAMFASLIVVFPVIAVPPTALAAPPAAVPDEAPNETSALLAARAGQKSVRVLDKTDESTEVRANPNGTLTLTQHLRPVRVKQAGRWTPVDMTLVRRPDGTFAPKVPFLDVTLSGGGADAPIVKVGKDGTEVGLGWPGALPEPQLAGPTATYPDVLPGVDLKVTADVTGFNQVLVVKTPQAAQHVKRVQFGSHTRKIKVKAANGLQAGENGPVFKGPVFKGTASRMWDSSGDPSDHDRLTGNGESMRKAEMDVQVTDAAVTIEPDQALLTSRRRSTQFIWIPATAVRTAVRPTTPWSSPPGR